MIDAHQHFWQIARGDYGWLTPALGPIHRDFGSEDLGPILARHGIRQTILVQAAPTVAETEFMLGIAQKTAFVAGVVGWVDFTAADAPDVIAGLARNPLLVGLRPMVHDIADDDWMLRDDLEPAMRAMVAHDLVFDALVRVQHLSRLARFVTRYPDLAIVVDHGAKPQIRHCAFTPWRNAIAPLSAYPHVMCKLSGLVTEAATNWTPEDVRPYCRELLQLFGPQRLMFGSDWPVVNLAGGYDAWRGVVMSIVEELSPADRAAVLGVNAARLYLSKRGRR